MKVDNFYYSNHHTKSAWGKIATDQVSKTLRSVRGWEISFELKSDQAGVFSFLFPSTVNLKISLNVLWFYLCYYLCVSWTKFVSKGTIIKGTRSGI